MALYKQNKYKGLYEVEDCEDVQKIMKIHGIGPKGQAFFHTCQTVY